MKHSITFLLIACAFLNSCAPKIQTNKITITEAKVLRAISELKSGKTSGPISLSFRKLELEEISTHLIMDEETTKAHLRATNIHGYYSLIAKNYPPGEEFVLYQIDLSKNVHPTKTFYVTQNGTLVTPLDDLYVNLENNFLFFSNYLPGEPVDFVLGSKNGKYYAATNIVPNPITSEEADTRILSVQINDADRRHYLAHGTGLEPFASYMMISVFENEKLVFTTTANKDGEIFQIVGPTVPWVRGGEASIELRGNELKNPLTLSFRWGF